MVAVTHAFFKFPIFLAKIDLFACPQLKKLLVFIGIFKSIKITSEGECLDVPGKPYTIYVTFLEGRFALNSGVNLCYKMVISIGVNSAGCNNWFPE